MKELEKFHFEGGNAVEVRKMDLFYGDFQALKNINMTMPEKPNYGHDRSFGLRKIYAFEIAQSHERSCGRLSYRRCDSNRRRKYL